VVDLERRAEDYLYKIFKDNNIVDSWSISATWKDEPIENLLKDYLRRDELKSKAEKETERYNYSTLSDKASSWVSTTFRRVREWYPYNIKEIRDTIEPQIDLFLESMIWSIESFSEINREDIVANYFILDEQAISNIKTSQIEWIDMEMLELSENIWDLFYDSLASFLSSLWEKLKENSDKENSIWNIETSKNAQKISNNLFQAATNILNAWEICKPFISNDFPEMKHTTEVKWLKIDKVTLANKIWNLTDEKLNDLLQLLSDKIKKDGLADEWRGRLKLANELYSASRNISQFK
jgi:hypothetical protein